MDEKAIVFYLLLEEAMIAHAEEYYDRLYASIFHKQKPNTIKKQLNKISKIIEDKKESDIMEDRAKLKNIMQSLKRT
jgi:hypothetical protein